VHHHFLHCRLHVASTVYIFSHDCCLIWCINTVFKYWCLLSVSDFVRWIGCELPRTLTVCFQQLTGRAHIRHSKVLSRVWLTDHWARECSTLFHDIIYMLELWLTSRHISNMSRSFTRRLYRRWSLNHPRRTSSLLLVSSVNFYSATFTVIAGCICILCPVCLHDRLDCECCSVPFDKEVYSYIYLTLFVCLLLNGTSTLIRLFRPRLIEI